MGEHEDLHAPAAPPERAVIGRYRLVQRLGEGGMGVVHLAVDRTGKAVALKLLRPITASDPEARARLRREVDALGRVSSPRVAPVIDADVDGPRPYLVTRYVPGSALDELVEHEGPLASGNLHRLAVGLAEAIEAIHRAQVVHRDIKPGNVLMVDDDPVLIDFGIAHLTDDVRLTSAGLVMGTPGYLAPEIVEGAAVTTATDWWGWAATLAFAASGRPPFGRGQMDAVLSRVARGEPDLTGVDPRLAPLLHAALSPRAVERPHRTEVVSALEHYAHGGDVTDVIRVRPAVPATQPLVAARTSHLPQQSPEQPRLVAPAPAAASATPSVSPRQPVVSRSPSPTAYPPVAYAGEPGSGQPSGQQVIPSTSRPLPGPSVDPRIGLPLRTGTVAALLVLVVAGVMVVPALSLLALLVLLTVARATDRSMTTLILRRHTFGVRKSDVPLVIAASPWHLVVGFAAALATMIVPVVVGATAAFTTSLVFLAGTGSTPGPNSFMPLAVGGLLGGVMAWYGPGGAGVRRGTRSLLRAVTPTPGATVAVTAALLLGAAALALWGLLAGHDPVWAPLGTPSQWFGGGA